MVSLSKTNRIGSDERQILWKALLLQTIFLYRVFISIICQIWPKKAISISLGHASQSPSSSSSYSMGHFAKPGQSSVHFTIENTTTHPSRVCSILCNGLIDGYKKTWTICWSKKAFFVCLVASRIKYTIPIKNIKITWLWLDCSLHKVRVWKNEKFAC